MQVRLRWPRPSASPNVNRIDRHPLQVAIGGRNRGVFRPSLDAITSHIHDLHWRRIGRISSEALHQLVVEQKKACPDKARIDALKDVIHQAHKHRGDVSVTNSGTIVIKGNNSVGIFAQSVGGGGGLVEPGGGSSELSLATGNTGNGGTVTVTNNADAIIMTGNNNDRDPILQVVGGVTTNTVNGYLSSDVNMDGTAKYTGTGNDRDPILQNIGGVITTNVRVEQLP